MNAANSLQGHFLVASPHLSDPNFFRSVVLMVQHDDEGAFGLILNRPTTQTVGGIWHMVSDEPCDCQAKVHHGGPVEGPLAAIHRDRQCSENEVVEGVFFSAAKEHLDRLIRTPDAEFRIFAGYSGWARGQLESELEAGGWLCVAATPEAIFGDADAMWKRAAEQIGLQILEPGLRTRHFPADPSAN